MAYFYGAPIAKYLFEESGDEEDKSGLKIIKKRVINPSLEFLFEKNPKAYGYTTKELAYNVQSLHWIHTSGMTADRAQEISTRCNAEAAPHIKIGGWEVAGAWFHNIPDNIVETMPSNQTNLNEKAIENSIIRANYNYNKITGKSLDNG